MAGYRVTVTSHAPLRLPDLGGAIDVTAVIPSGSEGPAGLVTELVRAGVSAAVARHRDALLGDPDTGNRRAGEVAVASAGAIVPMAVIAPIRAGHAASTIDRAIASGARACWLGTATWSASPATPSAAVDALLAEVARAGLPLFVPLERWGDATAIGQRTARLGIPVVLVGSHYTHSVDDLAAAERWPHLHLETSRMAHLGAVEAAVAQIGHERLLLGTGAPDRSPTAPVNAILAAAIPDDARRAILGGNAARLLGLSQRPVRLRAPLVANGAIDVHGHLAPTPWDVPDLGPAAFADAQARRGIAVTIASSVDAIAAHAPTGNAAAVRDVAGEARLRAYLVTDPRDLAATRADLVRHGDAINVVGVKVHSQWSGTATADPSMAALFDLLAAHGRPVKIHNDGDGWDAALRRLADRHPRLPIIIAHAGPGTPVLAAARVASATANVHLELASSFASLSEVRTVIHATPPDRLLFGTDAPLLEPAFALGTHADAGVSPETHPAVFRDTAARLFGISVS